MSNNIKMWTAEMILEERKAREGQLGHTGWYHVGCTCLPCRNFYDSTGEAEAKERNDADAERARACHEAGVPNYGDFSMLNFSDKMKAFLSDAYVSGRMFVFTFHPSYDKDISMNSNSFYMSAFADQLKLKADHTEETFKEVVMAMRDIQTDGWIEFAKKHKT